MAARSGWPWRGRAPLGDHTTATARPRVGDARRARATRAEAEFLTRRAWAAVRGRSARGRRAEAAPRLRRATSLAARWRLLAAARLRHVRLRAVEAQAPGARAVEAPAGGAPRGETPALGMLTVDTLAAAQGRAPGDVWWSPVAPVATRAPVERCVPCVTPLAAPRGPTERRAFWPVRWLRRALDRRGRSAHRRGSGRVCSAPCPAESADGCGKPDIRRYASPPEFSLSSGHRGETLIVGPEIERICRNG